MSSVSSQLKVNGVVAKVDRVNEALVTQDALHANVHAGDLFEISYVWLAVPDAAARYLLLETAATGTTHGSFKVSCTGTCILEIWDSPTTTSDGTPIVPINRNQNSTKVPGGAAWFDPTVTVPGSNLSEELIPAGSGPHSGGGGATSFHEWVLKPGTRYLMEVTNISGSAQEIGIMVESYNKVT